MKVQTSNGYVLLKETLTRKVARDYNNTLFKDISLSSSGEVQANPANVSLAGEALVFGLIEKIAVVDADGKETFLDANTEWLDNLPEADFRLIEVEAIRIKNESSSPVKK